MENKDIKYTSEYKFGNTVYTVKTVFNQDASESYSDILKRLITRECDKIFGEKVQEPQVQAV